MRAIVHFDGDSFFASVEQALNWRLRGKPVVVGAERGAATAISIEGKRLGLSRGMSMKQIRAKLDDLTVKASATGRITVLDLKIGQNVKQGDHVAELVPETGFKVSASVDEYYLPRVRTGQTAMADFNGKDVRLKATRVYPQVKDGVFTVDLAFDGAQPEGLTTGAAVQGRLSLGGDQPALVLPAGAFLERSGGDYVFVLSPDGHHADRRRIKLGRRNSEQVEVLQGLKPGERVITSDYEGYEKLDRIQFQ